MTKTRTAANITIEKEWDGNECVTERGNRIYVSNGRWQWVLSINGSAYDTYDTKREARQAVDRLLEVK